MVDVDGGSVGIVVCARRAAAAKQAAAPRGGQDTKVELN